MTTSRAGSEVFKRDASGRVWVAAQTRESLLDRFESGAASAVEFARASGVRYGTFVRWVQKRREKRERLREGGVQSVPLFEAVVDAGHGGGGVGGMEGLLVELPGGSRMRIESPEQMQMAAQLVALIAQSARARC